ncbi:dUTP diphosphatase [Nosocomiicoccus sp. HMSC059G07]|uniref:dUTP diphosphatase n=1 Tax=Nosocomiicoccus sp. HMSC059G07 TaxID=1739531 RepID=UPI0008A54C99|nr:dUTP diphosphatase [Nosocomiicoccus sp. HMSC059G07]OFO55649.1 hypothetical protein HMPREF3029_03490 [Nosocomiicoccus sp. HMSC059G07]
MNIQYKLLTATAKEPTRAHSTDAGIDLFTDEEFTLASQEKRVIKTGVAINIPEGYVGLLTGRSGISSKTDLVVTLGIIDSGYHGDIGINVKNDSLYRSYTIKQHMKLAQLLIVPIATPYLTLVQEFDETTERNTKGFGSSGE